MAFRLDWSSSTSVSSSRSRESNRVLLGEVKKEKTDGSTREGPPLRIMLVKRSYFHDSLYDTFSAIVDVMDTRYSIVQFSIIYFGHDFRGRLFCTTILLTTLRCFRI